MDVGGAGDFSVVIRTAVKTDGPSAGTPQEGVQTYKVGAGGAVTIQSTDLGEFLEMETKASSVLGALCR
jgi:para-aminobenzoate synthetase